MNNLTNTTKAELSLKVQQFLDSIQVTYVINYTQIDGVTLDFFIPDKKVAINVNDFISHNTTYAIAGSIPKTKKFHFLQTQICSSAGIRLIHAWEHCIDEKINCKFGSWFVLQNVIKSACGLYEKQIYARKTKVVEFPAKLTKPFFDKNNINGYRNASTTYALVYKDIVTPTVDDILMAYSVGHCFFGKGIYDAEIARGACVIGTQVIGGASKLWKYIIENTLYDSIVYYVDQNFYDGRSISFLSGASHVTSDVSFWNWHLDTKQLKNREPSKHSEIMQKRSNGLLWEVCNAGTAVNVWKRNP